MKRTDLIRKLESMGCVLVRHGARHDWYTNPKAGSSQEIKEHLAKAIIKKLSAK